MSDKTKVTKMLDRSKYTILIMAGIIAVILAVAGFFVVRNIAVCSTTLFLDGVPPARCQVGTPTPVAFDESGAPIISGDSSTEGSQSGAPDSSQAAIDTGNIPTWDGASRVNMLVMGLDFRDWEAGETPRTDTMILFTLDPITKTAGFLSIPRDMWVNIPGFDYNKINTAYYLGEQNQYPGGGPALAAETIEHFLGVPVHFYAQVDFSAFERFIDEIGGIVLHVESPITIYPIGKPKVTLEPGGYRVGGDYALAYARTRYTELGDFDRATRQQEVIMAIRWQILSAEMLPTLAAKAPTLYQELASGIRTNLTLEQVVQLAYLSSQVQWENIKHGIIGPDVVINAESPDNLKIMIPINDEIRLIRDEIFTSGGPVSPAANADNPMQLIVDEQARISIQNGSQTAGLANRTAEYLRSQGLNIVEEINADNIYSNSTLIIYNGKPYTSNLLKNLMGIAVQNTVMSFDPGKNVDIAIIVGDDWAANNTLP